MDTELPKAQELAGKVFNIHNEKDFLRIALEVFHFQWTNNGLYRSYCEALGTEPGQVRNLIQIPFLPVSFFKSHEVVTTDFHPELIFSSSGTTGDTTSRHHVKEAGLYRQSFIATFTDYFGSPRDYCIIGLLPSYLERKDSSLVYMVDHLIKMSGHEDSGFYLYDYEKLDTTLKRLEASGQKTMLFGVTFALLDFALQYPAALKNTMVLETGGMKGRKKEMTRDELYGILKKQLGVDVIYSEYGMTELLSQAYGADGLFTTPPWMKILLRDETDPLTIFTGQEKPRSGAINVIDLANLYSCSFIATGDLGRMRENGKFEVLGRLDNADIRGCSQLVI